MHPFAKVAIACLVLFEYCATNDELPARKANSGKSAGNYRREERLHREFTLIFGTFGQNAACIRTGNISDYQGKMFVELRSIDRDVSS